MRVSPRIVVVAGLAGVTAGFAAACGFAYGAADGGGRGDTRRGVPPRAVATTCSAVVVWNRTQYFGSAAVWRPLTRRLGTGTIPACGDSPGTPATRVDVYAFRNVPSGVAIGVRDSDRDAFLAPGYFPQLPSHPLHVGGRDEPNEMRGCVPTPLMRLRGRVVWNVFHLRLRVTSRAGSVRRRYVASRTPIFIDARTRILGSRRNGLPYIGIGATVAVEARGCREAGARAPRIVARRISVLR